MDLQKSIKDNSEALHDFLADLKTWEKEMKVVDQQLRGQTSSKDPNTPPVRCRPIQETKVTSPTKSQGKQGEKSKQTKQAENKQMASNNSSSSSIKKAKRLPCDYAAWEKFDIDKALESEEEEVEEVEHKPAKSPTPGRNPRASKKERANTLKEEGNQLYGKGRLEDAVAKYTQGMALDPTNAVLPANRAMAYIKLKKFTAAEADCNRCLKLDSNYLKVFLRRATARLNLGKEELARRDYLKVLEMEPHNKEAQKGLEGLNRHRDEGNSSSTEQQQPNDRLTGTQKPSRDPTDRTEAKNVDTQTAREGIAEGKESEEREKTDAAPIKRKGSGRKVNIVEVNSSISGDNTPGSSKVKVPNQIFPIDKPPHLRSKKPLKRIPVKDIASWEEMEEVHMKTTTTATAAVEVDRGGKENSKKTEKPAVPLETAAVLGSRKAMVPTVPRTSHQFSQDWHRLSRTPDAACQYLKMIPPSFFRTVDLETNTLVELAQLLVSEAVPDNQAAQYLNALAVSHGFSISLMFLEADQKQVFLNLITKCKQVEGHTARMEELAATISSL